MRLTTLLQGRKTYIVVIIAAVLNACVALGWLQPAHMTAIDAILGAFGLAALRNSVG